MKKLMLILFCGLLFSPLSLYADLICKGKRVDGFSKFDVLRYCGEPKMKDSYLVSGRVSNNHISNRSGSGISVNQINWVEIQQWFYVNGYEKISYTVEFEQGKVARIIKGKPRP